MERWLLIKDLQEEREQVLCRSRERAPLAGERLVGAVKRWWGWRGGGRTWSGNPESRGGCVRTRVWLPEVGGEGWREEGWWWSP